MSVCSLLASPGYLCRWTLHLGSLLALCSASASHRRRRRSPRWCMWPQHYYGAPLMSSRSTIQVDEWVQATSLRGTSSSKVGNTLSKGQNNHSVLNRYWTKGTLQLDLLRLLHCSYCCWPNISSYKYKIIGSVTKNAVWKFQKWFQHKQNPNHAIFLS